MKRRYYRWIEMGVLDDILSALAREADLECLMIDSTIVRAHQHIDTQNISASIEKEVEIF